MNKIFKKVAAVALAGVLTATAFAGCSKTGTDTNGPTPAKTSYKIGICQLVQHDALDAATKGFMDKLNELGAANNITFEFDSQNASGETTNCTTIVSNFVSNQVDLIMANATDAMAAASQATDSIPIVATSITDYATGLSIQDWTGKTGFNVTGSSDLAPLADQAAMIKELCPDAKTVGILYCSAEKNSKYQSDVMQQELTKLGITCKEYTFVDTNDVTAVTQQIVSDKCDVVFAPTDNTAASNTEAINNVLEPAKIPVIAGEEGICKGCGIATLSISYYSIGQAAGQMAYDILVNGQNPGDMEIQYATELTKKYMPERAEAIGVTIPDGYEAIVTE